MAISDTIEEAKRLHKQASDLQKMGMTTASARLKRKAEAKANKAIARLGRRPGRAGAVKPSAVR